MTVQLSTKINVSERHNNLLKKNGWRSYFCTAQWSKQRTHRAVQNEEDAAEVQRYDRTQFTSNDAGIDQQKTQMSIICSPNRIWRRLGRVVSSGAVREFCIGFQFFLLL